MLSLIIGGSLGALFWSVLTLRDTDVRLDHAICAHVAALHAADVAIIAQARLRIVIPPEGGCP